MPQMQGFKRGILCSYVERRSLSDNTADRRFLSVNPSPAIRIPAVAFGTPLLILHLGPAVGAGASLEDIGSD